jgi:hypothetical protein
MSLDSYKPTGSRPPAARLVAGVLCGLLLFAAGVGVDRWAFGGRGGRAGNGIASCVGYGVQASGSCVGYDRDGVPVGFAATVRGAGDAAAWFETLIAAASSQPPQALRALLTRLVASQAGGLVEDLMPTGAGGAGADAGITQTVVARVWAANPADPTVLAAGAQVPVQTYGVALLGRRTDGASAGDDTGLAGGWVVHDMVMQRTDEGWALARMDTPVPVPGPDVRGSVRDDTPRNTQALARVLGPDSWVPEMTP